MKTKCEVCKHRFEPEIKQKMVNEDLQDIYYSCPKCFEHYHIAYTDTAIRKYNMEIQQIRQAFLKNKENKQLADQMQAMMKKHKLMMDNLNKGCNYNA